MQNSNSKDGTYVPTSIIADVPTSSQTIAKPNVVCRLSNTRTGETEIYKGATYTKLDGVYGYVCVDGITVKFFYEYEGQVCCDQLMQFIVIYGLS